jgi:hypothetical protein
MQKDSKIDVMKSQLSCGEVPPRSQEYVFLPC